MLFLTLSKVDIWFAEREQVWRTYMAEKTLLTTRRVKIIDKKKFVAAALNADNKIFVVYIGAPAELITILIYLSCQANSPH